MTYLIDIMKAFIVFSLLILPQTSLISAAEFVSREESELVRLLNGERCNNRLPPLKIDLTLMSVARQSSQYMADKDESSHHIINGKRTAQRVKESGYCNHDYSTEIILTYPLFTKHSNFAKAMESWMNSSEHKDNILASNKEELGVGLATSRSNTTYFTVVFSSKISPYEKKTHHAPAVAAVAIKPSIIQQEPITSVAYSLSALSVDTLPTLPPLPMAPPPLMAPKMDMTDLALELLSLINQQRTLSHIGLLQTDITLVLLAEKDAAYMASHNKLTHNHDTKTPIDRVIESGFCKHRYSTEIIAVMSDFNLESVVQKWMASPTSKQILDPNYQMTGMGIAPAKDGKHYIAQVLSRKTPVYI
jgi:uncharacterized protein YkwD